MSSSAPNAPDPAQTYKSGLQIYEQFLPQQLQQEQQYRELYDPQRVQNQLNLPSIFGETQQEQQRAALATLDPQAWATRQQLGLQIGQNLEAGGTDPTQTALYNQLGTIDGQNLAQGGLDRSELAA